ncbi:sugar isomerase, KpsF/GutQ [Metarhizium album ARSEF 1941]|uniref:Sugar isomerase, KpsF/GutQ n=1 Tax=Metarhizium album (strain ARSEF 1941) TaxID=1081103 RepID=A0A0B2WSH4_METAS|nr:sugar isomerase, KpsF/GutQ [Metarhizium album ARSEF 1941]KHN96983.1 sugar isomerase, KpsF/GutQ [Metarhizium album ARSEF 1941]
MTDSCRAGRRPIQTSAVIVLGSRQKPALPPPSPPTPCASPSDQALMVDPTDEPFSLEKQPRGRLPGHEPAQNSYQTRPQESPSKESRLRRGLHVLSTEAVALAALAQLYETDPAAREGFDRAVQVISRQGLTSGKLVVIGVGKSGHIGKKLVATLQSLDIRAVFLHPTEALHGDLGIIDAHDTLLFITFSGKTQELMRMLPHLDDGLPTILLTSHTHRDGCEFIKWRPKTILLPAPIPESEQASFGVSAPSTSTTVALALGDALAITAANEIHHNVSVAFAKNHPGGAIGAAATAAAAAAAKLPQRLKHICVSMADMPSLEGPNLSSEATGLDLLRAGFDSKSGWVRIGDKIAAPSRIKKISNSALNQTLGELSSTFVSRHDMIVMSSDTTIHQAGNMIRTTRPDDSGDLSCATESIVCVADGENVIGVVEARHLLEVTQHQQ